MVKKVSFFPTLTIDVFQYLALFFVELFFVQYDFSVFFCNYRNFSSTTEIKVLFFLILVTYKRVVGFRYVKKGCSPTEQRNGVPSGDQSAVMVGNTPF